jgi:uncharacterized glyoxalase superfamily metalloenzyme YdcJ
MNFTITEMLTVARTSAESYAQHRASLKRSKPSRIELVSQTAEYTRWVNDAVRELETDNMHKSRHSTIDDLAYFTGQREAAIDYVTYDRKMNASKFVAEIGGIDHID